MPQGTGPDPDNRISKEGDQMSMLERELKKLQAEATRLDQKVRDNFDYHQETGESRYYRAYIEAEEDLYELQQFLGAADQAKHYKDLTDSYSKLVTDIKLQISERMTYLNKVREDRAVEELSKLLAYIIKCELDLNERV